MKTTYAIMFGLMLSFAAGPASAAWCGLDQPQPWRCDQGPTPVSGGHDGSPGGSGGGPGGGGSGPGGGGDGGGSSDGGGGSSGSDDSGRSDHGKGDHSAGKGGGHEKK